MRGQFSRRRVLKAAGAASVGAGGATVARSVTGADSPDVDTAPARDPAVLDDGCPRPTPTKLQARTTDQGTYFVNDDDRVVVLHGVNMVDKGTRPPSYPPSELDDADVERLASWGFNFVRIGIQWAKLAPRPPSVTGERDWLDDDYLDRIQRLVRRLADHDIYVLIDFHQDIYSREFNGNGAPRWAVYDEGLPFVDVGPWWAGYLQPAVLAAFDNFWKDRANIQKTAARAWRGVAERLAGEPNVVGYDLFNEPVPGPETFGDFERRWLSGFANRVVDRIREVDTETAVWVEPAIYFGGGISSRLDGVTDPADNLGFSFHSYPELILDKSPAEDWIDPCFDASDVVHPWLLKTVLGSVSGRSGVDGCIDLSELGHRVILGNALEASSRLGAAPVMTEFGAHQDADDVADAVEAAAGRCLGWAYWQYKPWARTPGGWLRAGERVSENITSLVRPYPHAVAGTPRGCTYERGSRVFELGYRPNPDATAETVLHVPERVYGGEYTASVSGGEVACRSPEYLRVRNTATTGTVTVTVEPS